MAREPLTAGERLIVRAGFVALGVQLVGVVAFALAGGRALSGLMLDWVPSLMYVVAAGLVILRAVRVPERRAAWALIGTGLALYAAGNVVWVAWLEGLAAPPIPSVSDVLWLALYPLSYLGLVLLERDRRSAPSAGVWLDGIIAGLGITALGAAVVVEPVLDTATGSASAVATNLAYPVADLLLAALVMGVVALRGGRLDASWALLGGGFLLLCGADIAYLLDVASGAPESSAEANVPYLAGVVALAAAAWRPSRPEPAARLAGWGMLVVPTTFAFAAVGLLLLDHVTRLNPVALALALLTLVGALARTALTFRDVRALAETRRQATTDDLTALPNRRVLLERVEHELGVARERRGSLALLLLDLDRFKELNDTLGHRAGDLVLQAIGARLEPVLRERDLLARLGGDEFGLVLGGCGEAGAVRTASDIGQALREPFDVAGLSLTVTAAVGIAVYPNHGTSTDELLQRADIALYQAKAGPAGFAVYARERDHHSRDNLTLASELHDAIERGELEVHFQPKADARTRRIVGTEALVRWRHPERGLISPATFLPLADRAGMTGDITRFVLDAALAACRHWRADGYALQVSVNASVCDLLDASFPARVADALREHGLPARSLMVEVTETSVLSDPVRIGGVLERLVELGVAISLDDFGTGYSSLTHLRTMPAAEVKLDRSFVSGMLSDPAAATIVRSTIDLTRALGMRVVAEGVEDEETWQSLAALGCELVQGFHLARPLPLAELDAFLESSRLVASTR